MFADTVHVTNVCIIIIIIISDLTLTVQWQTGHLTRRKPIPLTPGGSLPEKVEDLRGTGC